MGERICKRRRAETGVITAVVNPNFVVVKANYVKRGKGAKGRAKASIRYIQHRRGEENERITRTLFGPDGPTSRNEAYLMIDESDKKSLFYRFVFSPNPKGADQRRDLDMR